jgi:predicted DCC family thiol-disulfide oxidoreductase YuxK
MRAPRVFVMRPVPDVSKIGFADLETIPLPLMFCNRWMRSQRSNSEGIMSTVPAALSTPIDGELVIDHRETEGARIVLFFDGVCGLCSRSIDFVLKHDTFDKFQFAPLQGTTARTLLTSADIENLDTMVLWISGRTYRKSAAVVRVLWQLGPGWQMLGTLLWLIPLPLRNLGYTLMAKNRYRLFGKTETCRLPTPHERLRFLP